MKKSGRYRCLIWTRTVYIIEISVKAKEFLKAAFVSSSSDLYNLSTIGPVIVYLHKMSFSFTAMVTQIALDTKIKMVNPSTTVFMLCLGETTM